MPLELRRPARTFTIRQLCQEFKCTPRALRFYEDKGLLTTARKGQTRVYDARDRARLKLILRGRRIGFTLQEIQEMLDLYDRKDWLSVDEPSSTIYVSTMGRSLQVINNTAKKQGAVLKKNYEIVWRGQVMTTIQIY